MEEIQKLKNALKPGRDTRLLNEWERIDEACSESDIVSYAVHKFNASGLPVIYDITFNIKSITGVEKADSMGLERPVFGDKHILRISIPNNYPANDGGFPEFKFITDVWHPNVRYFGDFKGRVCLNLNDCGTSVYLTEHIATIAGYLRYTEYHARDEHPFPEDQTVAKWVLEQAEPLGWLNTAKPCHCGLDPQSHEQPCHCGLDPQSYEVQVKVSHEIAGLRFASPAMTTTFQDNTI